MYIYICVCVCTTHVAPFCYKKVNRRLAKRSLKTNGRFANLGWTSLVKEATGVPL